MPMELNSPQPPSRGSPRAYDDDGDYEYYWSLAGIDIPIPHWLAEIVDVPLIVRCEIFLIGVCCGLVIAALAVLIAFLSAT